MKLALTAIGILMLLPEFVRAEATAARFLDTGGAEIGSASLAETTGGVLIEVEVGGLPPGQWVAFHIHETGVCDHTTAHDSAGGHFNPAGAEHGYLAAGGPHAGDMPNLWVGDDGTAKAQVFNPLVTYAEGETAIRGRALMIHAGPDDYATQPTGGAGDRLACAVID